MQTKRNQYVILCQSGKHGSQFVSLSKPRIVICQVCQYKQTIRRVKNEKNNNNPSHAIRSNTSTSK